jgi:hypothetical protein
MKTLLQTGQKVYIKYKGRVTRYVYAGFKKNSGFHRLDCFKQTLFLTDENLAQLIVNDYHPTSLQTKMNDLLDFLSFDVKRRVAS